MIAGSMQMDLMICPLTGYIISVMSLISSKRASVFLCAWLTASVAGTLHAARPSDLPHDTFNPNVEEYIWEEDKALIPEYPKDENLLEFDIDPPDSRFSYFIDTQSITVNKTDGVTRFTLVIRSGSGVSNVSFEAMRCTTKEYKIYAHGDGRGKFRQMRKPEWKPLTEKSHTRYRNDLWEHYICPHKMLISTPEAIIRNIKYFNADLKDRGFR